MCHRFQSVRLLPVHFNAQFHPQPPMWRTIFRQAPAVPAVSQSFPFFLHQGCFLILFLKHEVTLPPFRWFVVPLFLRLVSFLRCSHTNAPTAFWNHWFCLPTCRVPGYPCTPAGYIRSLGALSLLQSMGNGLHTTSAVVSSLLSSICCDLLS
eukprot:RCo016770